MLAVAMLASCSENEITTPKGPLKPGSEVNFTLRLADADLSTRTIYGDEDTEAKAFPIYWVDGDQVAMASPQAAVKNAPYSISVEPGATKQDYATAMTKIGEAGIQWGTSFPQNFYSIYPCKYTDVNDKVVENTIAVNGNAAEATLHVRDTQRQLFELTIDEKGNRIWKGTPVDETGMKNPDAIMYAQRQMNADGDVVLQYVPFTTAFNITLEGYELSAAFEYPVVIQEVIIEAPAGIQLVGDFKAAFDEKATKTPEVKADASVNTCTTPNIIHVPCLVSETNYLHPNPITDVIKFNVFAIPTGNEITADWKLHVKTNYKTYTRSLKPKNDGSGTLVPGQVHKLSMPSVYVTIPGETTLDPKTWMKSIPRNVYITDLSLPGAWYATQAQYQGNSDGSYADTNNKKGWTIQELWDKGVRAFSVETRTFSQLNGITWKPVGVAISGTGSKRGNGAYGNSSNLLQPRATRLGSVMSALCDALNNKSFGYALLMISYADGGDGGHREEDYAFWLQGIKAEYDGLSETQKAVVYGYNEGEEITPNTTIGDVAGRLIVQINVATGLPGRNADNDDDFASTRSITKGNYNNDMPALLTYINRKRKAGTAPVSAMHWKEWDDSYRANVGIFVNDNDNENDAREALKTLGKDNFYCNYSIANRTHANNTEGSSESEGLPTYVAREQALTRILRNSALSLELGNHNLWSTFAAGGTEAENSTKDTNFDDARTFAFNMNQWVLNKLDERIGSGNYGPFGNVFCNYIANKVESNGVSVDGNDIIERILRMNQLFRLSRDEDKPEWPDNESGTSAQSPANYSSSLSKDQNGWNAF